MNKYFGNKFNLLAMTTFFFATVASAEIRTEIKKLSTLHFDGTNLEISYAIGGGHENHIPEVVVSLEQVEYGYQAVVKVYDITATTDYAEAVLHPSTKVNLKNLIMQEKLKHGIDLPYYLDIKFPTVQSMLY